LKRLTSATNPEIGNSSVVMIPVTYTYDGAGRAAGVKNPVTAFYYAGGASTDATNRIKYTAAGAISTKKLGNGLWEHAAFNTRLQPTEIGLGTSGTDYSTLRLQYGYSSTDNNGNVKSQTITAQGSSFMQTYEYDELNRLKNLAGTAGWEYDLAAELQIRQVRQSHIRPQHYVIACSG